MILDINKNIDTVNDSVLAGKKIYQIVCTILGFAIAVITIIFLRNYLSSTLSSYVCMLVCMPLLFLGLYEKNGMDILAYLKIKKKNRIKLVYKTGLDTKDENKIVVKGFKKGGR